MINISESDTGRQTTPIPDGACSGYLANGDPCYDPHDAQGRHLTGREATCRAGCECRVGTDDADRRDCGCIGPCCYGWELPPCTVPDCGGVLLTITWPTTETYCSSRDGYEPCLRGESPPARKPTGKSND